MRATAAVQDSGVTAVPIVAVGFAGMAKAIGRALGIADIPLAIYDGVVMNDGDDDFDRKVREEVAPAVVTALLERTAEAAPGPAPADAAEPERTAIVFRGDIDAIQDHFADLQWSDGLPVVPPTRERVQRFLAFTDRDPDELLGVIPSENREATVWTVAVNGVMAGCRPEYMPLLLAVVEAIADPGFRLEDAGSTPGWEPIVLVSGRVVKDLDFNVGTGVMRVGRRANSSIGRFLKLYMRNVAGIRIPPSDTDLGSIGAPFHVAVGEDEATVRAIGWDPFRVDEGHGLDDNTVTVQSVLINSTPIYSGGVTAEEHFETIAGLFGAAMSTWCWLGVEKEEWHPLLLMAPTIATSLATAGATKRDLQQYLYDNLWIKASEMERYCDPVGYPGWNLADLVRAGRAPAHYAQSEDPDRLVRMLRRPEWTRILVAGSPARNQSRGYVNNHTQGIPTTKAIHLPDDWEDRIAR
jgi:hypothetical protein